MYTVSAELPKYATLSKSISKALSTEAIRTLSEHGSLQRGREIPLGQRTAKDVSTGRTGDEDAEAAHPSQLS